MKQLVITLMCIQILLVCTGIYLLHVGHYASGIFNILLNTAGFIWNMQTLKRI